MLLPRLTAKEVQILELISSDLSTRSIAARLYVSEKDVEYHVRNLIAKFGCRSRTGVVGRAFAFGYLISGHWPPSINPTHDVVTRAAKPGLGG